MVFDHHSHKANKLRATLAVIVSPIQYTVAKPVTFFYRMRDRLRTRNHLLHENTSIRKQLLLLQVKVQQFTALERENAQLRALLGSSSNKVGDQVLIAEILAVNADPFDEQVVLNKGKQHAVYTGQPVLDAYGVLGQIIESEAYISRVMLVTSIHSAVPVEDSRSGVRAVAIGKGFAGGLRLVNVPNTLDIKSGDTIVTSGLGLRFPSGYQLGEVKSVQHVAGEKFARIELTPSAHLNISKQVLLVWPKQLQLLDQVKEMVKKPVLNTVKVQHRKKL